MTLLTFLFLAGFLFLAAVPCSVQAEEWTIRVDASKKLGPSGVKKFLYVQGAPLEAGDDQGSNEASRKFEIAAWKALDLVSEGVALFDDADPGQGQSIRVVRVARGASAPAGAIGPAGPRKDLYLDTRNFDMMQQYWRETFSGEGFRRNFGAGHMPKALSSNPAAADYFTYPPADYAEWRAVLEAAVRYLNRIGVDDPHVIVFGEPESEECFNVLTPGGEPHAVATEPVLREYVRLYAESQRAVKAADPGAKVYAMCAGVWGADLFRDLRQAPEQKGLDDFIAYVSEYNEALPAGARPAELDNICWQGYSWKDEKRMMPMAEHIQSVLQSYGFDHNVPQYLSGWSGGWASPRWDGGRYPLSLYAPHLVYNVIEQLNPGGEPGPIAQAHYYTWNLDGFYASGAQENASLVRTVHDRIVYGPASGHAPSDQNCLRPAYIAFQALKTIEKGDVLAVEETRPLLARSIAVSNDAGIRVLLVNYTDARQPARLTLEHLPATAQIAEAMLRHVPSDEVCGADNWFPTEDLTSTFLNESAQLTRNESGAVTASVALPPNGVALLDIPNAARSKRKDAKSPFITFLRALMGADAGKKER